MLFSEENNQIYNCNINISANKYTCYIIDNNGNLYSNRGNKNKESNNTTIINNWQKISLPDNNNKRLLQCAVGTEHLLCLVEDNEVKGKIYAKGNNYCN